MRIYPFQKELQDIYWVYMHIDFIEILILVTNAAKPEPFLNQLFISYNRKLISDQIYIDLSTYLNPLYRN